MAIVDFNKIFERNYRRSFLFAKSFVHDDMVAEDIVAESLFKFWQYIRKSEGEVSDVVLLTILKNAAIDYLRHEKSKQSALEDLTDTAMRNLEIQISSLEACDPDEIFSDEIQQIVENTLKTMSEQTRQIFIMSRYENKTVKEIAELQHITSKAVEYHITKSLKALRVALKDYFPLFLFLIS